MDVVMPDQSGLDVVPTLLHERPETKVLVLSMQDDPQYVRQAFANAGSVTYGVSIRSISAAPTYFSCTICTEKPVGNGVVLVPTWGEIDPRVPCAAGMIL